jgi:hypothetical protein
VTTIVQGWTGGGKTTAKKTLAQMARNIRGELASPEVWETARNIVAQVPERDQALQARVIRSWCKARFRYVADPVDIDLLASPRYLLDKIKQHGYVQGDCDDAAALTAALVTAIGIPAELHAVAFISPHAPFTHVFTIAYPANGPAREMDVSHPDDSPPRTFTRTLIQRV